MTGGVLATIALAIIGVASLSVAVSHTETAQIIQAFGNAFSTSLSAAKG